MRNSGNLQCKMIMHGISTFDLAWEAGEDSIYGLSFSEQNASTNDSPKKEPHLGPEARFSFGYGF